jgi:phosphoserine phosphatase RsbU/P
MTDKPAAYQLGIYISAVFIIVFGIFTYWSFSYYQSLIRKNAESNAISISTKIISTVNEKLFSAKELAVILSEQLIHHHTNEDILEILENFLKRNEHIASYQILVNNAEIPQQTGFYFIEKFEEEFYTHISHQEETICFEVDKILTPLSIAGIPAWSEPFTCPRNKNLAILYYFPFSYDNNSKMPGISGYIVTEVSLDFMNQMILETKVGKDGFAFLIRTDGTFITHPVKEYVLTRNLFNLPPNVFKGEKSELQRFVSDEFGSIIVYPDLLNNKESIAFHTKIKSIDWVLATVYPMKELNRELNKMVARIILLLLILVTAIFIIVFLISSRIMKPLSEVAYQIHTFSNENNEYEIQVRNEAEALSHSLKRLRKTYEKFRLNESKSLIQSQKIERELLMASEIQKSIIPPEGLWSLIGRGLSLFSVFRPANMVSGDLYDFFMIDDKHFLITIGDVSGSGVPAALFMGVAHTFMKSYSKGNNAKTIVKNVNMELCRNNSNQYFLTLFLGILNIEDGTFNYCNAGHTPTYHIRKNGKMEILTKTHGLPLGLFQERIYEESTIHLNTGDKLVLFTDGVTDQANEAGEHFGEEHFRNIVKLHRNEKPELLAGRLMNYIDQFSENNSKQDDLSLLVFQFEGPHKSDNVGLTG